MSQALTPRQIIHERFAGRQDVAAITGATPNAVSQWYAIGIPPKHWPALVKAAAERNVDEVTFEALIASYDATRRAA